MPWRKDEPSVWVDPEAINLDSSEGWRKWLPVPSEAFKRVQIHPYAEFYSLERAAIGIAAIDGDLTTGRLLSQKKLRDTTYFEPLAPLVDFEDALQLTQEKADYIFEETPFAEISTREEYNDVLEAQGIDPKDEPWEGPGVYDMRESPPGQSWESAEEYERQSLEEEADRLIEYMFSGGLLRSDLTGDEWKDAYSEVLKEAWEEVNGG